MARINPHSVAAIARLRGISVSDLARAIDVPRPNLSTALNGGGRRIPEEHLPKIADVLGVSPQALLGPDDLRSAVATLADRMGVTAADLEGSAA